MKLLLLLQSGTIEMFVMQCLSFHVLRMIVYSSTVPETEEVKETCFDYTAHITISVRFISVSVTFYTV